jgi:hypothetical protein
MTDNAAWRRWYRANASRKIAWQDRRRRELRAWFRALRATKACEVCGENAPECLHFHHIDRAKKEIDVSTAIANGWSRERILREMAKCRVLCANCHLKHHWNERQLWSG